VTTRAATCLALRRAAGWACIHIAYKPLLSADWDAARGADARMAEAARARGISLTSRSRPLAPRDLADFNYIIGMDHENIAAIHRAAAHWAASAAAPPDYRSKARAHRAQTGTL
jgi:hypothetical protein